MCRTISPALYQATGHISGPLLSYGNDQALQSCIIARAHLHSIGDVVVVVADKLGLKVDGDPLPLLLQPDQLRKVHVVDAVHGTRHDRGLDLCKEVDKKKQ